MQSCMRRVASTCSTGELIQWCPAACMPVVYKAHPRQPWAVAPLAAFGCLRRHVVGVICKCCASATYRDDFYRARSMPMGWPCSSTHEQ